MIKTKCSVYIAASLDGFIARPDGDIEWLHNPDYGPMGNDGLSYEQFISGIDALVMGRNTFEKVLEFDPWPYVSTPVAVLTSRPLEIPGKLEQKVIPVSGEPEKVVQELAGKGFRNLYIDGGLTIQQFLEAGLIDKITITQIPVLLGDGIPLFGKMDNETQLSLIDTTAYKNGFVQFRYEIRK
ncbi:MAG: dihydrofolate reductase [Balneolaceae bacterium]|nr:dihydrofolate reductase [Balneolaceae bacterium]